MAILRSTTIVGSLTLSGPLSANEQAKATDSNFGLVKLGYINNGRNYKLLVDENGNAYTNVPSELVSPLIPARAMSLQNKDLNDYNSASKCGYYYAPGGNGCTNQPASVTAFGLEVYQGASGWIIQRFTANQGQNMWIRAFGDGNWTSWKKLAWTSELNSYLPLSGGTITGTLTVNGNIIAGALTANGNVTARGFKQSDTSKKYVDLISGDGTNFGGSGVGGNIYDLSTFDQCYRTAELGNTTFKVTRGASVSLTTTGFWSAMVNSSNGSGKTPSNGWWHIISMDWAGNDINNRFSQLAIPTQDNNHLYYRKNASSGQSIANATRTKVADASDISNATIIIAQSGKSNQTFTLNQSGNTTISLNDTHDWNSITGKPSSFNPSSHSHNYITSLGNITAESGTADISVSGLSMANVYNNGYPCTYGNVIRLRGSGMGEFVVGWSGSSGANEKCYYRSQRDTSDANWSSWDTVASERWVNTLFEGGDSSTTSTSVRCYVKKDDAGHAYVDVPVSISGTETSVMIAIGTKKINISQSSESAALQITTLL